jgi:Tfp pilus assembly protein FimV
MLLSKRSQFMVLILVAIHGWASANEPSKQPPLELPKTLLDGEPVAMVEKAKPDPVKKAAPKSEAVTSREVKSVTLPPAKPAAARPVAASRDLSGLPEMTNYTTRKGDTVEKILQKFYPASPLRADVLRDALVQNNPKAFPKGNAKSLVIGSNVSLPDPLELSRKLLLPVVLAANKTDNPALVSGAVAAAPAAPTPANPAGGGGAAAHSAGHNMAMQDPKRHWVRYP